MSVPLKEITDALLRYADEHRNPQALWFANWLDEQFKDYAHKPHRDDDVAAWLKRVRDSYITVPDVYHVVDRLLDHYRERADYGLTLHEEDDGKGDP